MEIFISLFQTPHAKSNGKFKAAKSQKQCGSRVLSCKSNEDLFLKTPETAPKRKSLIGQKSKPRLSLDKNSDKGQEKKDIIFIDENMPDENRRRNNPFSSKSNGPAKEDTFIKSRKSSGCCNAYPEDLLCVISDDEDDLSKNKQGRRLPSLTCLCLL